MQVFPVQPCPTVLSCVNPTAQRAVHTITRDNKQQHIKWGASQRVVCGTMPLSLRCTGNGRRSISPSPAESAEPHLLQYLAPCSEWAVHSIGPCNNGRAACLQVVSVFGDASFQKDDGSAKLEPSLWDTLMTAYARWGRCMHTWQAHGRPQICQTED